MAQQRHPVKNAKRAVIAGIIIIMVVASIFALATVGVLFYIDGYKHVDMVHYYK